VLDTTKLAQVRGKPMPHYLDALRRFLPLDAAAQRDHRPPGQLGTKEY
jgi:hypothetical protein